eukprot:972529-Pleurochrysis_carterae.AAC.1
MPQSASSGASVASAARALSSRFSNTSIMSSMGAGLLAGSMAPTRWRLRPCLGSLASSAPAAPIFASFSSSAPRKTKSALASQRRRF